MVIQYITQEGLDDFSVNPESYREHFFDPTNEWIVNRLRRNNWLVSSNIECEELEFNMEIDEDVIDKRDRFWKSDLENVKMFREKLYHKLKPAVAFDMRFWAGFAILHCWDYVKFRKSDEFKTDAEAKTLMNQFAYVITRENEKRRVFVHCISRLYWAAKLLYDDERDDDKFWALESLVAQAFPSKMVNIGSYSCIMNKNVLLGIMDALEKIKRITGLKKFKRDLFVASYQYVDMIGGAMLLDLFPREKIAKLVYERFKDENNLFA